MMRYKVCRYGDIYAIQDKWHHHLIRKDGEDKRDTKLEDALTFDSFEEALIECSKWNAKLD